MRGNLCNSNVKFLIKGSFLPPIHTVFLMIIFHSNNNSDNIWHAFKYTCYGKAEIVLTSETVLSKILVWLSSVIFIDKGTHIPHMFSDSAVQKCGCDRKY